MGVKLLALSKLINWNATWHNDLFWRCSFQVKLCYANAWIHLLGVYWWQCWWRCWWSAGCLPVVCSDAASEWRGVSARRKWWFPANNYLDAADGGRRHRRGDRSTRPPPTRPAPPRTLHATRSAWVSTLKVEVQDLPWRLLTGATATPRRTRRGLFWSMPLLTSNWHLFIWIQHVSIDFVTFATILDVFFCSKHCCIDGFNLWFKNHMCITICRLNFFDVRTAHFVIRDV